MLARAVHQCRSVEVNIMSKANISTRGNAEFQRFLITWERLMASKPETAGAVEHGRRMLHGNSAPAPVLGDWPAPAEPSNFTVRIV